MWLPLLLLLPLVQEAPAAAKSDSPAVQVESTFSALLHLECQGAEAWLVDQKDQRLLAALQMLDDRLLELPTEIPNFNAPPGALPLALSLLSGPKSLTLGMNSGTIAGMPLPFAGELRLTEGSGAEASKLAARVAQFIQQMGLPLTDPEAGQPWTLPVPVPLWMGESDGAVVLRLGLEQGVDSPDLSGLLPDGVQMASAGLLDYGSLLGMLGPLLSGSNPELNPMMDALETMGMDELSFEWASGTDAERSYTVLNMPGWAESMTESGLMAADDMDPRIVNAIPGDATWAMASAIDIGATLGIYRELLSNLGEDQNLDLDQILKDATGLDLEADLVAPFGKNVAIYASDSTGGGGIFSTVALVEIADSDAFGRTWGKLEEAANQLGASQAKGYMGFRHLELKGLDIAILSFPGLPMPFELCMAEVQNYAVLAVTPQALLGAVYQVQAAGDSGLLGNPSFLAQLPRDPASGEPAVAGVQSMSWINTPRLMQDGYSAISLMCSALANAVRSPAGLEREPGIILPRFNKLKRGALPILSVGRRVGPDFRSETRGDRSVLVNGAGIAGYVANSPFGPLMAVGMLASVAAPRLVEQQAETKKAVDRLHELELEKQMEQELFANIDVIYAALEKYSINNGGKYPESLLALTIKDENGKSYMPESLLFDPWGDAYIYEAPEEGEAPFVTYEE